MDCPDDNPIDKPLVCRLNVKLASGDNVTASIDWGDGKGSQIYIINQTSTYIERKYNTVKMYDIKCNIIETGSIMTERANIRREQKK